MKANYAWKSLALFAFLPLACKGGGDESESEAEAEAEAESEAESESESEAEGCEAQCKREIVCEKEEGETPEKLGDCIESCECELSAFDPAAIAAGTACAAKLDCDEDDDVCLEVAVKAVAKTEARTACEDACDKWVVLGCEGESESESESESEGEDEDKKQDKEDEDPAELCVACEIVREDLLDPISACFNVEKSCTEGTTEDAVETCVSATVYQSAPKECQKDKEDGKKEGDDRKDDDGL